MMGDAQMSDETKRVLTGLDYPKSKDEIVSAMEREEDVPKNEKDILKALPSQEFESMEDVVEALTKEGGMEM